jgi:hypothetical protein
MKATVKRRAMGGGALGKFQSMERITRPFAVVESEPFNRLLPGADADYDPPEAIITWGASSQFIIPPITSATLPDESDGRGVDVTLPDDGGSGTPVVTWNEIARTTSDLRVENPEDPEQYVIIRRIESMTFEVSTGVQVRMRFRNV